ncbi:MAG TPA: DNA alkylation repair protein [Caulobacteraceae bacterium]|nr:DNA alkylation repair protein [Caulobacteraceae bacterium]
MTPGHAELVAELEAIAGPLSASRRGNDSSGGSGRPFYGAPVPDRRRIVRGYLRRTPDMSAVLATIESLVDGVSHDERTLAALILGASPKVRALSGVGDLERWLDKVNGWAEVDSLTANVFKAEEMAAGWPSWRRLIERLAADPNPNKRRAALVLLTGPTRSSEDPRFAGLALEIIERLQGERSILITKAVSWLLRSMCGRHQALVTDYLGRAGPSLPAIAARETRTKLATGTKSGRSASRPRLGASADAP